MYESDPLEEAVATARLVSKSLSGFLSARVYQDGSDLCLLVASGETVTQLKPAMASNDSELKAESRR